MFGKNHAFWKRGYYEGEAGAGPDGGAGAGGGGGGGGGTGSGVDAAAELERLRTENAQLNGYYSSVKDHIEIDASGNVKLKGQSQAGQTEEDRLAEAARAQESARISQAAQESANLIQLADTNKKEAFKEFQDDPLFAKNAADAEKFLAGTPVKNRNPGMWKSAYQMAMGAKTKEYQEIYKNKGKEEAMAELGKGNGAALPKGGAAGKAEEGSEPWRSITLDAEQLRHAEMQVASGWIPDIDTYKKNMRRGN